MDRNEASAAEVISDELYSAFEEEFRGSREEVARRLSIYLPVLEQAGVRETQSPVLDLGCGRGEWLELLGQHEYAAKGIDLNEEFVVRARQRGIDVVRAEAVTYLSAQPAGSYAAVTSFHLVEHLPAGHLVDLLAQAHRVLGPGGLMILETPNPENHTVGTCDFYLDPTHVSPIPPALLKFLVEQAGFALAWVARVNADVTGVPLDFLPKDAPNASPVNAAISVLNKILFSAPDYAVIAQKQGGMISIAGSPELERLSGSDQMDATSLRLIEAEARAQEAEANAQEAEAKEHEAEANAQEAEAKEHEAEANAQEAEAKEHEAEANAQEAEARAQEAEAREHEAEARAQEAEAREHEAEARAQEAEAREHEAEARAQEAEAQFAAILGGASWRITRPLRSAKRTVLRFVRSAGFGDHARPWLKTRAKTIIGHPMRWLLARPHVGPVIAQRLARVPSVDRRVRAAVREVSRSSISTGPTGETVPTDLEHLPVSAREVFADLERNLDRPSR
jgi:SAM-dependent methyltransferase